MKTSNKILLAMFLAAFGFITVAQVALKIKYSNNDFIPGAKFNAYYYEQHAFNQIKYIDINGISQCQVYSSGTTKLFLEKVADHYAQYHVNGDTLFITGFRQISLDPGAKIYHSSQEVKLYVPSTIPINATNANLAMDGDTMPISASSRTVVLNNSNLTTRCSYYRDSTNRYFDTLTVVANNKSGVFFFHNDHLRQVNMTLNSSVTNDNYAKIDDIQITADSNSTVVINGKNIPKLNTPVIRK